MHNYYKLGAIKLHIFVTLKVPKGWIYLYFFLDIYLKQLFEGSGFTNWPFMTVHSWGENPLGKWTLEIHNDAYTNWGSEAKFFRWSLKLYGTTFDPNSDNNDDIWYDESDENLVERRILPEPDGTDIEIQNIFNHLKISRPQSHGAGRDPAHHGGDGDLVLVRAGDAVAAEPEHGADAGGGHGVGDARLRVRDGELHHARGHVPHLQPQEGGQDIL